MTMNKEVKKDVNDFAHIIAKMSGYQILDDYDFEESPNPEASGIWAVAKASYSFWSMKFSANKR